MPSNPQIAEHEAVARVLRHLGIERAHFAGREEGSWRGVVENRPEVVASITLIGPVAVNAGAAAGLGTRLLILNGDTGGYAPNIEREAAALSSARYVVLKGYEAVGWGDPSVSHVDDVVSAMKELIQHPTHPSSMGIEPSSGDVDGVTWELSGSGPPLILLPLGLSPTQWTGLVPALSNHFTTIVLGGRHLGMVRLLEARGASSGFSQMVRLMVDELEIQPGESILDVGPGTGVHDRFIARQTAGQNAIVGADISPYLRNEATALAAAEGLDNIISFGEGSAELLPHHDESFDITIAITVMEEVDADKMMAELFRVTKPGGRIGVIVRSVDQPWMVHVDAPTEVLATASAPGGQVGAGGCADRTLYDRFVAAGLTSLKMFPFWAAVGAEEGEETTRILRWPTLKVELGSRPNFTKAAERAIADGSFVVAQPYHVAIGTKPA